MSNKTLGVVLIIVGVLILAASLLADVFGVGAHPAVFGWKQIAGAVVGLVICLVGVVVTLRRAGTSGER
jgi:predicted membrane protein